MAFHEPCWRGLRTYSILYQAGRHRVSFRAHSLCIRDSDVTQIPEERGYLDGLLEIGTGEVLIDLNHQSRYCIIAPILQKHPERTGRLGRPSLLSPLLAYSLARISMVQKAEVRELNHSSYEDMSNINLIGKPIREVMVLEGFRVEREVGDRSLTGATMGHDFGILRV